MKVKILPKYKGLIYNLIFIMSIFLFIFISYYTLFKWFLPFILAYLISFITNPIVNFMETKLKLNRKIASGITVLFTISFVISLIVFIIYRIIFEVKRLSEILEDNYLVLLNSFNKIFSKIMGLYDKLPKELNQFSDSLIKGFTSNLMHLLTSITESTTKFAYNFAMSLPSVLVFIIVLILSTYFISSDKRKISRFIKDLIPDNVISKFFHIKRDLLHALLGYIKAQFILMLITFFEVTVAMIIIGVDYALLMALLISFVDALPLVGSGIILLPWSLASLILGDYTLSLYLLILYGIILLVRQVLEPKIIGSQIGLYPLITLMSMYVGLKIFGFIGMIFGPIIFLIFKSIIGINITKLWKD